MTGAGGTQHPALSTFPSVPNETGGFAAARRIDTGRAALRFQVLVDQRGHLEHRDLILAAEDDAQLVIGVDHPLVGLVLQTVLLHVIPHALRDFAAWDRLIADDDGQIGARLYRCGEPFAAAFGWSFRSHSVNLASF